MANRDSTIRDAIGVFIIGTFIGALVILHWKAIPAANEQLITYMLGQLSGFAGAVIAFHYTQNALNVSATQNTGKAFDAIAASAAERPTGTVDDPVITKVEQPVDDPIPVEPSDKGRRK